MSAFSTVVKPTTFSALQTAQDSAVGAVASQKGGRVVTLTAGASLNIGDVVFYSAADTVNKSATSANYVGYVGVVVGGDSFDPEGRISYEPLVLASPVTAATTGQKVLVQIDGIAEVRTDGAVTLGTQVICTATNAGRVISGTTAGQILGTALATVGAAGVIPILVCQR